MLWCFVKGFGYTFGGTLVITVFFLANYRLGQWLIYEYDLEEEVVVFSILGFWMLSLIGIIVSLAICGVLK